MKNKIATLLLSACLMVSVSGSALASSSPAPEVTLAHGVGELYSPGPGFPLADGVDELASTDAVTFSTAEEGGIGTFAAKAYKTTGFSSGVYIGGATPTIFSLNSIGKAIFSSVYQNNVNPGESISISYQTLNANTGNVLAGKNLNGIHSTSQVDLTTKVQRNTAVNAYLYNFSGNLTEASGNFNY